MIVPLLLLLLCLAFFLATIALFKRFDSVLRRIYEIDHDYWKKLGGPTGYFWHPKEKLSFFRSTLSRDALFFSFIGSGLKEPNKALEPTSTAVTDRATHAPRQP